VRHSACRRPGGALALSPFSDTWRGDARLYFSGDALEAGRVGDVLGDGRVLVWIALPVRAAAGLVAALMIGALAMHLKVGDPLMKSLPAALMLALSTAIVALR
jgi:hypothetical protein